MKKTVYYIIIGFLLMCIKTSTAQPIPTYELIDWSKAGLFEVINEPINMVSVMDFGAFADGIHDDSEAVSEALLALNEEEGILFFPPGTYLLTQTIYAYNGLIIRGAGSEYTHLQFLLSSDHEHAISAVGSVSEQMATLLSGMDVGSHCLVVDNADEFLSGDQIELQQENGDWDTHPALWAENSVGQLFEVENIVGNQLYLSDALRIDFELEKNPIILKTDPIQNVKIENLKIERLDEPDLGGGKNIFLSYVKNIQISGVESVKSQGSHIYITHSSHVFMYGNYLHDAFLFDGTDTRGYGICLNMHSGNCLIENNIFKNLRHAMIVKTGANGNVFTYNYSREPHRSEPISNYSGDISVHGHYAFANLFEENIVQNIIIDHYWGPGGPYNTFFRNRTELFGIIMTSDNEMETQTQNFIGNELLGNFPFGLYLLTGSNHFEYANNDGGNCIPGGTSDLEDISYFYEEAPEFIEGEFPGIGYPNNLNEHSIPAKERWLYGDIMTVEWQEETVGEEPMEKESMNIRLIQNPVSSRLVLEVNKQMEQADFQIYSIDGQVVYSGQLSLQNSRVQINTRHLSPGYYILSIGLLHNRKSISFVKH